jgi:hypothetical protein
MIKNALVYPRGPSERSVEKLVIPVLGETVNWMIVKATLHSVSLDLSERNEVPFLSEYLVVLYSAPSAVVLSLLNLAPK